MSLLAQSVWLRQFLLLKKFPALYIVACMKDYIVILFYKFVDIEDPEALKEEQKKLCASLELKGRLLIAKEGINGTFEGEKDVVEKYMTALREDDRFSDILFKTSKGTGEAFPKLSIKVRDEVVTLGVGELDIKHDTAKELPADEFEKWYEDNEDFVVLDLRNDYEIASGAFEKTVDPGLRNFRDLPEKLEKIKDIKDKKIVSVCTGGIRCEKATAYLKKEGFENLYQLKDGIHTYMQKYPNKHFKGTLFVFDNRITTPVVDAPDREVIGHCTFCDTGTEQYVNDDSTIPSTKLLCCDKCYQERKESFRAMVS